MIGSNSETAALVDDAPPLPLLATALTSDGDVLLVNHEPWLPCGTTHVRVERLDALLLITNQTGDLIAMAPAGTIQPQHRAFHLALTAETDGGPIRVLDLPVALLG